MDAGPCLWPQLLYGVVLGVSRAAIDSEMQRQCRRVYCIIKVPFANLGLQKTCRRISSARKNNGLSPKYKGSALMHIVSEELGHGLTTKIFIFAACLGILRQAKDALNF